jgi:sulfur carrier protein ThiS
MDISKFAKKPELIKVTCDQPEIVEEFGETIDFWMWDNVDINTYFDFYKLQQNNEGEKLNDLMRKLILNEQGTAVLKEGEMFPVALSLAALVKIGDNLGKSKTKSLTPETGTA